MSRLQREVIVTEKIDGTNAQIYISEDGSIQAGSRNRWITPQSDNMGFAKWVEENKASLLGLGVGRHYGEWWGNGIQRTYGIHTKVFSLFNTERWIMDESLRTNDSQLVVPACCHVVPILWRGIFNTVSIARQIDKLRNEGSRLVPGWMKPEGIVVFHTAANKAFKWTIEHDECPKSLVC